VQRRLKLEQQMQAHKAKKTHADAQTHTYTHLDMHAANTDDRASQADCTDLGEAAVVPVYRAMVVPQSTVLRILHDGVQLSLCVDFQLGLRPVRVVVVVSSALSGHSQHPVQQLRTTTFSQELSPREHTCQPRHTRVCNTRHSMRLTEATWWWWW